MSDVKFNKKKERLNTYVDPVVVAWIKNIAEVHETSISNVVNVLLLESMSSYKDKQ